MTSEKITKLANSLSTFAKNNEKLFIPFISNKLEKCIKAHPQDQTMGAMLVVFNKMASNNNKFIKRSEFKDLYNKLYSRGTRFNEFFQDELGIEKVLGPVATKVASNSETELDIYKGDEVLANALSSAFDNNIPLKEFSSSLAKKAETVVSNALDSWNLTPKKIEVESGNDKFLVAKVSYDSPKGITTFCVPFEIKNNNIEYPTSFITTAGPKDFNKNSVKDYVVKNAGVNKLSSSQILELICNSIKENRQISAAEIALIKLNAIRKNASEFSQNQIIGQEVDNNVVKDVVVPRLVEADSFESKFNSVKGLADFNFGSENIKLGNEIISRELNRFGYTNPQVKLLNSNNDTLFYGISLEAGRMAFTIPIKVSNNKLIPPQFILCNGTVSSLSKETINNLFENDQTDCKVQAFTSPLFDLKPSELINEIKLAVNEANYAKAEDALNILKNANNNKAYAIGFKVYMDGLGSVDTVKEATHNCDRVINNKTSKHPICGHTGLPLHKIAQDKYGNCIPKYRENMVDTYDGALFMAHKIFG